MVEWSENSDAEARGIVLGSLVGEDVIEVERLQVSSSIYLGGPVAGLFFSLDRCCLGSGCVRFLSRLMEFGESLHSRMSKNVSSNGWPTGPS